MDNDGGRFKGRMEIRDNNNAAEQYDTSLKRARQLMQKSKDLTLALESIFELCKDKLPLNDHELQEKYKEIQTYHHQV